MKQPQTITCRFKQVVRVLFRNLTTVFLALLATGASATTVIPPTFEEMADKADLVFVGSAISSRAEWRMVGTNRLIFTLVEFETKEVLKGNAGKSVSLQFLGGTIGDVTLEISGVPKFDARERVILFVEKNGVQFCPLVGVYHGKFNLQRDVKTGRDIVLTHEGKPLRDVSEIGTGEGAEFAAKRADVSISPDSAPLSVDDFTTKIRAHVKNRARQK